MLDGVVLARKTGASATPRAGRPRHPPRRAQEDHRLPTRPRRKRRRTPARLPLPARPHRRGHDLRGRRQRPPRRLALRLSRRPALLGPQDPQRPQQGQKDRPQGRQTPPPRRHECLQLRRRAHRRFAEAGHIPEGRACATTSTTSSPATPRPKNESWCVPQTPRRFREVRRRTRPMGTFQDRTSMDRIFFAIFSNQNKTQRTAALFP